MKFVIVSGGVLSGLGKGIITSSLGVLLKSRGFKVTAFKCDMYLNIDAGTMNPLEHGEVFVTHDGLETDQDLGHYERFIHETLTKVNYTTNGQVYQYVLDKERSLFYGGDCVQPYHHIPPEIIKRWEDAASYHKADIVLIEMGGTVGEYEGLLFFEAARRLKLKYPNGVTFVHVGYLPAPGNIGELKSKPLQQSIYFLNTMGIHPDFIVGRAEKEVDQKRKDKIALASGINTENIISSPDLESVYQVPLKLEEQGFADSVLKSLHLRAKKPNLTSWKKIVEKIKSPKKSIKIAIVGKYQKTGDYTLEDAYVSVVESLRHAGFKLGVKAELIWVNSQDLETMNDNKISETFKGVSGIIVPQGWGSRGAEGKIRAIQYARTKKIPYLGLCYGMQMATIEYGRNVLGLKDANSEEIDKSSPNKVIHLISEQKEFLLQKKYGGTIRLGAWPCILTDGSLLQKAYKDYGNVENAPWYELRPDRQFTEKPVKGRLVYERHRHRYEFNNEYKKDYIQSGFVISGFSPDGNLVEAIEIPDHPFFLGTQFHPEYMSRLLTPHPIFVSFLDASSKLKS